MTTNSTSVPDLNLTAYVAFARNVLPPLQLKTPALKPVLDAFTTNVVRLQNMLLLPGGIAFYSARLQNQADRAELEVTGTVGKHMPVAPQPPNGEVVENFRKILHQEAEEDAVLFGTPEGSRRTLAATINGFQTIDLFLGRHPDIYIGPSKRYFPPTSRRCGQYLKAWPETCARQPIIACRMDCWNYKTRKDTSEEHSQDCGG